MEYLYDKKIYYTVYINYNNHIIRNNLNRKKCYFQDFISKNILLCPWFGIQF